MSDHDPWRAAIDIPQVLSLYSAGIERFGGKHSAPKDGCLEEHLGNAYTAELYTLEEEDEDSRFGLIFLAHMLVYIAKGHCFTDGNKRLAWSCMTYVLYRVHGLDIAATDDDAYKLCIGILEEGLEPAHVLTWLEAPGRLIAV